MPMRLDPGWNQIVINLADYVKRAYGTNYVETTRVTVHANCRLRRIYFTDRLYTEDELPAEFKLFLPVCLVSNLLLPKCSHSSLYRSNKPLKSFLTLQVSGNCNCRYTLGFLNNTKRLLHSSLDQPPMQIF